MFQDQEEQFKTIATAEDNELFKSCSFEPTFDCEFLSQISSLGNVSVKDDFNLKQPVSAQQVHRFILGTIKIRLFEAFLFSVSPGARHPSGPMKNDKNK